jgi:acyl CoA:acetate/3-ketoacid CoA transferase beta subunit
MDANNVSFGKPKATGAVFVAPLGTTLPTNATTNLHADFKNLGYVSEDGLVNSIETDTETNVDTLTTLYGEDNVTEDGSGNITLKVNSATLPACSVVFELVMTGGRVKRIVVGNAQIVDRSGEITYVDGEAVTYPTVFNAYPDEDGDTHKEYITAVES